MKNKRKLLTMVLAGLLALLLVIPIIFTIISAVSANASLEDELDELRAQADALADRQWEISNTIESIQNTKASINSQKVILDERIDITRQEIEIATEQIRVIEGQISDKENEYLEAQEEEAKQYKIFKERVRAMEENGSISYFSIIFEARDFGDFLSRLDFINEIMAYDEKIVANLEAAQAVTEMRRLELEEVKLEAEIYREQQLKKQEELKLQVEETIVLMKQLEDNAEEYRLAYEENERLEQELSLKIDETIAEIERIAEENAKAAVSNIVSTGSYIWPTTNSTYITSFFGGRVHPISGVYTNHNGVDIGADYGTEILAADSGIVVTAEYDSSYGYYVMIAHGGGRYTLYAHMSEIAAWTDEYVSQGEVIGYVGSTGYSTGPHIHFEIYVDGSRVDPLDYFDNWYY